MTAVVDLEERSWLPRHCRGDKGAFGQLMAAYRGPVYGYLNRAGIAAGDRDDLFQTVFINIHRAAARYQPARPLAPWLFTIVANAVRNHRRDRARDPVALDELPDRPDSAPGPESQAATRETVAWLDKAIADLPPGQREVLSLSVLGDMAHAEVATALDLPLNTVKTHLRRARLALVAAHQEHQGAGDPS